MRSAPCASAPSHPLHAMPPRITRNSDRPRASDRTMVNIVLLAASCILDRCHQQQRKLTRMDHKPNIFRGNPTQWAGSRERISSGRGGAFFLTSLFIELIDPIFGEQTAQACANACSQQLSSSSAMNDNWKPYLCKVNGKLASIFVNLGLRDAVPNRVKTLAVVDVGLFSIAASRWPIRQ